MSDIKYIDPAEFRSEGYLQEVNRRFLHPLGLAIEVFVGKDEDKMAVISATILEQIVDFLGDDEEGDEWVPRLEKAIEAAAPTVFRGVWDYRDDPEGINFEFYDFEGNEFAPAKTAEEQRQEFMERARHVDDLWGQRKRARVTALGYMVQPYGDHYTELGSDIVALMGRALGDEMSKVIPVKAKSESWQKAARGILDKLVQMVADEDYHPENVTAEEVHLMDLLMGPDATSGRVSRAEALNHLIDQGKFWHDMFQQASQDLARIAAGDFPPGESPQSYAEQALANLAGDLGG